MNVDYKELYISVQRQIGDLSLMVDKYQNEIIPQYEQLLKAARAERDANAQAVMKLTEELGIQAQIARDTTDELTAALKALRLYTGCFSCKHKSEPCDYEACGKEEKLWEWARPEEVTK